MEPLIIYRDKDFEEKTKRELETSRDAMQRVLDEWLRLELGPCMGLNDLVLRPRAVYDRAVNEAIKVPEQSGPVKLNPVQYREQFIGPDPSALYIACKSALRLPYCAMYGLFIVNDDKVEMNEETTGELINNKTRYSSNPEKIKLIKKLQKWAELTNSLNADFSGTFIKPDPITTAFCRGRFKIIDNTVNGIYQYRISPDPDFLESL